MLPDQKAPHLLPSVGSVDDEELGMLVLVLIRFLLGPVVLDGQNGSPFSVADLQDKKIAVVEHFFSVYCECLGSTITNRREPRSCLGRVFNFKLGSFT